MQSHSPNYAVSRPGSDVVLGFLRPVSSAPGFFCPSPLGAGSSSGSSSSGPFSSSSDDESGGELAGESLLRSISGE